MTVSTRLLDLIALAERESRAVKGVVFIEVTSRQEEVVLGRIAADDGCICWAMAADQTPRISDIFAEECGVSRERLEENYRAAAAKGTPFGEELIANDVVGEEELRRCLRRQMVTALGFLARLPAESIECRSLAARDVAYDPAFTVEPLPLLVECLRVHDDGAATEVPGDFASLAPRLAGAVCFLRREEAERALVPLAAVNLDGLGLQAAVDLGRDALAVVMPPALRAASVVPYATLVHREGQGFLCTSTGGYLCVYEVRSRGEYGELIAQLVAGARRRGAAP